MEDSDIIALSKDLYDHVETRMYILFKRRRDNVEKQEVFMKGYLNRDIKITFLDNLHVIGMYVSYYYFNNVIVIMPEEAHDDTRLLIPMSAIKTIEPWNG